VKRQESANKFRREAIFGEKEIEQERERWERNYAE
jgi:hypothetical protein